MEAPTLRTARHPKLRRLRKLGASSAARIEAGLFVLEGPPALMEALDAGARMEELLFSAKLESSPDGLALIARVERSAVPSFRVEQHVLERCAPTRHGRGAVALLALPGGYDDPGRVFGGKGTVVLALGVQDPGNLGSIVRTSDALGAAGVVVDASGADPWGPKCARASAGALARLPVARGGDAASLLEAARRSGRRLIAAVPRGGRSPAVVREIASALVLGAEGGGLSPEQQAMADERVSIPLAPGVDSLGVAVAAAILLYEATARQVDPGRERDGLRIGGRGGRVQDDPA